MSNKRKILFILILILPIISIAAFLLISLALSHKFQALELHNSPSLQILDRNGIELYELPNEKKNRSRWHRLEDVSPALIKTTLFKEDRSFFRHSGVNPYSLLRAGLVNMRKGRIILGGSTITMQLAKMINQRIGKALKDKLKEVLITLWLEAKFKKKEILAQYLNRVYYGNQLFGCESAAQHYFGKSARDLTLAQSAFLSVISSSPSLLNPYKSFDEVERKRKEMLYEMLKKDWIDMDDYEIAVREKIELQLPRNPILAPHFVFRILKDEEKNIYGISKIRTTLDYYLQREAQKILRSYLRDLSGKGVTQGAVLVMDNRSAEWLVWIGSVDFWNEEDSGQIDGCFIKRQPGSTLKPFLYALSFSCGFSPSSILPDLSTSFKEGGRFYIPKNYTNQFSGPVRARVALSSSINVPAVFLLSKVGTPRFYSILHSAGFESLDRGDRYYGLGLALGSGEVTLYELVRAYSIFARKGLLLPDRKILALRAYDGQPLISSKLEGKAVFDEKVSFLVSSILSDNFSRGLGFGENSPLRFPYQVAVKTGTSEGFRDNFCIGYTKDYTVGVWVGNFSGRNMKNVSGVTGAGPIFHAVMNLVNKKRYGNVPIGERSLDDVPKGIVERDVCPLSGMLASDDCEGRVREYFLDCSAPKETCDWHIRLEVDRRNELLAARNTPPDFREKKVFVLPPPSYMNWAIEKGLALPPRKTSTLKECEFEISFPKNGSIFQRLPDLPKSYQSISLELRTRLLNKKVIWMIDKKVIDIKSFPFKSRWKIEKGLHEIAVKTQDGRLEDRIRVYVQ